jgi:4-amino-4-deoxy-L-arabinose transferase-like glycosyltransferase
LNGLLKNSFWILVFVLVIFAWISGLFIDLTGDSGLYAAISRQMVESGDWLNLKIHDEPYIQKPHLFFWLAGLGIELFGNTNFAFKLFPFLFALAGIYSAYRLGWLLFSEIAGRLAALFTGASQMYFLYFLDFHTDTVLQAAVTFSLWQLAEYLQSNRPLHFILGFFGIGLAMLTKGPVGAVLPFFFVLFYLVQKRDFRQLFHPKWLLGIFISMVITFPSLYHLWRNFGSEGIRFYFIDNNLGRVSGAMYGSSTDPFYYLYNLLWAFLPWTAPVIAGLIMEVKSWFKRKRIHIMSSSLLGGVLVLLLVFSIARGKALNYLMMLMPPMAVVAAGRLQNINQWSGKLKSFLVNFQMVVVAITALLLVGSAFLVQEENLILLMLIIITATGLTIFFFRAKTAKFKRLVFLSLVGVAVFNLYLNAVVLPALFEYQGARQVINNLKKIEAVQKQLYIWDLEEYEIFFMAEDSARHIATWEQMYEVMAKSGTWLYTNEWKHDEIVQLEFDIDTVYRIKQRGMNKINFQFLNPKTRNESMINNYLIKLKQD